MYCVTLPDGTKRFFQDKKSIATHLNINDRTVRRFVSTGKYKGMTIEEIDEPPENAKILSGATWNNTELRILDQFEFPPEPSVELIAEYRKVTLILAYSILRRRYDLTKAQMREYIKQIKT